ncbi:hypothetical protein Aduo_003124 [Ancylostoma duodenale]
MKANVKIRVAGGTQEKKRIINEITQQFLRTFRLSNGKNKENGIDARPALQTNNFLCRECFEHQKEQMMSFNCENPHLLKRIPAAVMSTTAKSTTMPAIATPTRCTSRDALRIAGQNAARPAPVLGVTREGMSTTTNISTIEGENGVTHYYVSGEDPPVHLSPSHASCAASQTMSPVRVTATLSQLAS